QTNSRLSDQSALVAARNRTNRHKIEACLGSDEFGGARAEHDFSASGRGASGVSDDRQNGLDDPQLLFGSRHRLGPDSARDQRTPFARLNDFRGESMDNPLISVIVPVFNRERFLGDALQSIVQQDYRPLEIIVVDDGSTDGSAAVARSFPEVEY